MPLINLRVSLQEREALHEAAKERGLNLSDYLRSLAGLELGRRGRTPVGPTDEQMYTEPVHLPPDERVLLPALEARDLKAEIEKRTKQLYAQGNTMSLARKLAIEELAQRS